MHLIYLKKILGSLLMTMINIGGLIMLSGCASVQAGERFGIGIASRLSKPPLEEAILISDTKDIRVEGTGAHNNYGVSNGMLLPTEIEFIWRAAGEKETHLEKIKLRSQIPSDVLSKIGGTRPMYYFSIEFFVYNKAPRFRWRLTETAPGQTSGFKEVERGGDW